MKRITCLSLTTILFVLFAGCTESHATLSKANQSKIASVIGQMPAKNSQLRDELAAELVALNPEATIFLSKMLLPPTDPNDIEARYGLSALTHYVARSGAEAERKVYASALTDALAVVPEKQNKAFLITQLQFAGKDEAIAPLAKFLSDAVLCDYAARAMLTIGTKSVEPAFLKALNSVDSNNAPTIIKALGELQSKAAVKKITPYAKSSDLNTRETALYALANIGNPSSQRILNRATRTKDAYQRAKYTSLYLLFARRQAEAGNPDLCVKICKGIIKRPGTPENILAAATNILSAATGEEQPGQTAGETSTGPMNTLTDKEKADGFALLFNGTDLTGWVGSTDSYGVKDGVLFCRKKTGRNIYTKEEYDNFVLRFEFKLQPGTNNGLGIRAPLQGDAAYKGMELQILDNTAGKYSNLHDWQYHGSIYGIVAAKRGYLKPVGQWNIEEVIADGTHIIVKLNGTTIVDADIKEASKNGTLSGKKHPGLLNETGHIGFLGHGDFVEFRNIRIKKL